MTITVLNLSNEPVEVDAIDCGVPGLAITPALGEASGWAFTHVPTGRAAGWWPEGTVEHLREVAPVLGKLADWTSADPSAVATAAVRDAILRAGGWIANGDHYMALEDGELTRITCLGGDS